MQVRLKVLRGKSEGREIRVTGPKFIIGRDEKCNLRPRSEVISRQHCEISLDDAVKVRDLGSRNGTFVNDTPVKSDWHLLVSGDVLRLGKIEFEVSIDTKVSDKRPKVKDVKDAATRLAEAELEDSDVSSWLEEADEVEKARKLSDPETRQFKLDETDRVKLKSASEETKTITDHDTSEDIKEKPKKKEPGKLPRPSGPSSKDSVEAASDMLRKFFNNR